jgi:hypothetical protein
MMTQLSPTWQTTPPSLLKQGRYPFQTYQLATILHNILIADPGFNAPVLEKIQTPPADPTANPIQLFSAADLSHPSSHLAITATNLAQHAQPGELSDISDI